MDAVPMRGDQWDTTLTFPCKNEKVNIFSDEEGIRSEGMACIRRNSSIFNFNNFVWTFKAHFWVRIVPYTTRIYAKLHS